MAYTLWLADSDRPDVGHLLAANGRPLCRAVVLTNRAGPPLESTKTCVLCLVAVPAGQREQYLKADDS